MSDSKPSPQDMLSSTQHQHQHQHVVLDNENLLFSILNFCNEESRRNFVFVSRKHCTILTSDASFKWRVECLHRELGIYHPLMLVPSGNKSKLSSWKEIFLANHNIKDLWQSPSEKNDNDDADDNDDNNNKNTQFNVQVSARFKPRNTNPMNNNRNNNEKKISLPLYQRLALIQMNRNLKTKKEAFKALFEQGEWSNGEIEMRHDENNEEKKYDNARDDSKSPDNDDANVESSASASASYKPSLRGGVHLIDPKDNFAVLIDPIKGLRKFDFDNVFHEECSQDLVYEKTTMPLIWQYLNGFNASCIVYGQTGR